MEVSDLFNHYCFVISMVKKNRNINYYDSFWIWTLGFVCNVIKYLMLISMMKSIHYKNICYLEIYFKGVCQCRKLFIGEDCSHAISTPPTNLTLPGHGLCETSKRACAKTNIFGHFWSEAVHAKLKKFEVTKVYDFKNKIKLNVSP